MEQQSDYPIQLDGNIVTVEQMMQSKKKKRPKRKITQVEINNVERYEVAFKDGLSDEQVLARNDAGLYNVSNEVVGKTYKRILFTNLVTFFNFLTFGVATALLIAGAQFSQLFFVLIILTNVTIGIWQEFKAKYTIGKLSLISAPTAMVVRKGNKISIPVAEVVLDDIIFLEQGKQIPSDATVLRGDVEVNESMITGESVPIPKKLGATLYSGSFVSAGSCYARVERVGSANYVETLSSHAKRYVKPKSELQNSIRRIIKVVTIFIIPISILLTYFSYVKIGDWQKVVFGVSGAIIGMIPAGMFLLTSIALFVGQSRLAKKNVLVQDLYCIEMLARVDMLCLDKTGTITDGTMQVNNVVELRSITEDGFDTKEIIGSMLSATGDNNQTALALVNYFGHGKRGSKLMPTTILPFNSQRKMSVVGFADNGTYFLGAPEFILKELGAKVEKLVEDYASQGFRVIALAHSTQDIKDEDKLPQVRRALALIVIEDHIRADAYDTIKWFKENSVGVKVISGDNPITVAEVAKRVGIENAEKYVSLDGFSNQEVLDAADKYTVFGRVTPEQKSLLIQGLKIKQKTVAMTGDGVNDILAMREADCAISIASGAEAARNVAHLVLMDNNFTSMPDVVSEGRRVINNIQKSSSLFLMKTLMTILLTIVVLFNLMVMPVDRQWMQEYPLQTNNLLMLELFIVGVPSTFLALQTNKNIISGKFLYNVLSQSIPGGLALLVNIMAIYFFRHKLGIMSPLTDPLQPDMIIGYLVNTDILISMLVLSITFTGMIVLLRISQPLDTFRTVLMMSVFFAVLIAVFLVGDQFGIINKPAFLGGGDKALTFEQTLFVMTQVLLSYGVVSVIMTALKKIKI